MDSRRLYASPLIYRPIYFMESIGRCKICYGHRADCIDVRGHVLIRAILDDESE